MKRPLDHIFSNTAPLYRNRGYPDVIPVKRGGKTPLVSGWSAKGRSHADFEVLLKKYPDANIGALAGMLLPNGRVLVFIDIDDEAVVPFIQAITPSKIAKVGSKGVTLFYQADLGFKSAKLFAPGASAPAVEIFVSSGQTVLPPSIHPNGKRYRWIGQALLDTEPENLPLLTAETYSTITRVLKNKHAWEIVRGGASVKAHDLMLRLTGSGIANHVDDLDGLADALNALFHPEYSGDTKKETLGLLQSAKDKQLGSKSSGVMPYEPGEEGPAPLGFTRDGLYAFRDQTRNIIILASQNQLLSPQYLVGLAPSGFWQSRYPSKKGIFHFWGAGESLIAACKKKGPFNPLQVRGRGIWREGDRIIVNFGDLIPADVKYLYLCFEPILLTKADNFETSRLLKLLKLFPWRNPQDATLLLGWLALAPICGVLNWRPHCFVYGPPQSGKTTIHALASKLLYPLGNSADGSSSEAGLRQRQGPDSLPVLLDEFESDQSGHGLRSILRLARSASSADTAIFRGTPEGKAMQFSLRTTFFFSAVNAGRMSPADQSRIMLLELLKHSGDRKVAKEITDELAHFRDLGAKWCGYMLSVAALIESAIEMFERLLLSGDKRHRLNFATLLAGAFVAVEGRVPAYVEAAAWVEEYAATFDQHAENVDRDNSVECLNHLLAYVVERYPLSHWIALAREVDDEDPDYYNAERITRTFDIIAKPSNEHDGVLIRNGSPNIDQVYRNTIWEGRAWERALRSLDGAFSLKNPVYFTGASAKSRVIGIPTRYIPPPIERRPTPEPGQPY